MRYTLVSSALLAASLAFSPFAIAATTPQAGAQAATQSAANSSTTAHNRQHQRGMRHMRHHGHRNHRGHDRMALRKLDLSDAQRTQIRQLAKDQRGDKSRFKNVRDARTALGKTTPGTDAWQSAAANLATAEGQAASQRVLAQTQWAANVYQVLTPAQRTRWSELRSQRQERMQKWSHHQKPHAPATPAPVNNKAG